MTRICRTAVAAATMLLILGSVVEAYGESPERSPNGSPTAAVKAEPPVESRTGGRVKHAAQAAGHGIKRGATTVVKGIGHGASAVGQAISRTAAKVGSPRSASPAADK